jgi:predicted nucleic acid-binding protein
VNEKPWSPATLATDHPLVALDANVLIYVLEGSEEFGARARAVVDAVDDGLLSASMATVGQVEILAGPARIGDAGLFERTADEIRSLGITLVPLTSTVAEDAAWLRGQGGLDLADAIHVAGARAAGATALITNDRRIRPRPSLDVLYLDDMDHDPPPT